MRITVTTYGDMTADRALHLAACAVTATKHENLNSCAFSFDCGAEAFVETTEASNLSVKVRKFEAEKTVETGGEA
jgi:hypothetical protein